MEFTQILFEVSNHVAKITLNRPEAMNAFSEDMLQEFKEAIDIINKERSLRVVTITGAGKAFCAGGDLKAMVERSKQDIPMYERRETFRRRSGDTIRKIKTISQPVIAVLNGATAGAGCGLSMACDMRFASDRAKFVISFVKRGLGPDFGTGYFLPRLVGTARALELACTGRIIDAATAYEYGLVNRVVPHDELDGYVSNVCGEIADNAPIAVAATKSAIYHGAFFDLEAALEYEAFSQGMCGMTEDHKEGARAFVEKRPPLFQGR